MIAQHCFIGAKVTIMRVYYVWLSSSQPNKHDASILTNMNMLLPLLAIVKACLVSNWGANWDHGAPNTFLLLTWLFHLWLNGNRTYWQNEIHNGVPNIIFLLTSSSNFRRRTNVILSANIFLRISLFSNSHPISNFGWNASLPLTNIGIGNNIGCWNITEKTTWHKLLPYKWTNVRKKKLNNRTNGYLERK